MEQTDKISLKNNEGERSMMLHCKHNSLVDFSFLDKGTNALKLTHLNALFEKIADRDAMVIRADKLFRLILKTDINKHKIELYRRKLGISKETDHKADAIDSEARMISRGPFISIFKHESFTFVNSLETAAKPLSNRRKKKRKKKSTGSISGELSTLKLSIKTDPIGHRASNGCLVQNSCEEDEGDESKSLKRKKVEDKMGMIIVAEIDHDEISAVSVSPTSSQVTAAALLSSSSGSNASTPSTALIEKAQEPLSLIDGNYSVSSSSFSRKKKSRKDRNRLSSSRKSSRKSKRQSSLRSIKSIGRSTCSEDSDDADETSSCCSRSLFTNQTLDSDTIVSAEVAEAGHERSPSNFETAVNIREVMDEHSKYGGSFAFVPPPVQGFPRDGRNPYIDHAAAYQYNMAMGNQEHYMNMPPGQTNMMYAYPPSHFNYMHWQQQLYLQQQETYSAYYQQPVSDNIEYEECFLIKGVTSFLKKVFGIDKKKEAFEPSPIRNIPVRNPIQDRKPNSFYNTSVSPCHQEDYRWTGFEAPRRPRTRSRVFSDDNGYSVNPEDESIGSDLSTVIDEISKASEKSRRMDQIDNALSFKNESSGNEDVHFTRPRMQSCEGRVEKGQIHWRLDDDGKKSSGVLKSHEVPEAVEGRKSESSSSKDTQRGEKDVKKKAHKAAKGTPRMSSRRLKERSLNSSSKAGLKQKKKALLDRPKPKSISSSSRSKTDSLSLPKPSLTRPSLRKSVSTGLSSTSSQNRARCNAGYFHYR